MTRTNLFDLRVLGDEDPQPRNEGGHVGDLGGSLVLNDLSNTGLGDHVGGMLRGEGGEGKPGVLEDLDERAAGAKDNRGT